MLTIYRENLTVHILPETNKDYFEYCTALFDDNYTDVIAVINNGETQYEFEVWEQRMICYIAERLSNSESAEYESVEELDVTYLINDSPTLNDFINNIVDFVLEDKEAYDD
jgi:hypothetical protein